jgi:integrase
MRGHVRKRGKTWAVVVELPRDPISKQRRQKWHSGYPSKKDAEAALADLVGRVNNGSYIERSKQNLAEYLLNDWLPSIVDTVRPDTLHSYERNMRLHVIPTLGGRRLADIDGTALNALYAQLRKSGRLTKAGGGLSPRSVAYVHTILHRAFKDAVTNDRLIRNPADRARPPKASATEAEKPEMVTWTGAEVDQFLRKSRENDDRYYTAWLVLVTTGLRRGELLGLQWTAIDLDAGTGSIRRTSLAGHVNGKRQITRGTPKTAKGRRSIALDAVTVQALRDWRKLQLEERLAFGPGYSDSDLIFCHADGTPYHPERFSREFARRVKRWEMRRIRLHDLRHTNATLALEGGVHPRVVQERLGHANVGITLGTYSHVTPAMDARAADVIAAAIFTGRLGR